MKLNEKEHLVKANNIVIKELRKEKLTFNELFILQCYYENTNESYELLSMYNIPSFEDLTMSSAMQNLKKQMYLVKNPTDSEKIIISVKGKNLYESLIFAETKRVTPSTSLSVVLVNMGKTDDEKFEEWWKAYPSTPSWISDDKTVQFVGSRTLKNMVKKLAKKAYLLLLNQGLEHEELLGSLKYEIALKKADSVKKNENQMNFFKGMESYLNSERYLIHMEDYRNNKNFETTKMMKIKSKTSGVTDI